MIYLNIDLNLRKCSVLRSVFLEFPTVVAYENNVRPVK